MSADFSLRLKELRLRRALRQKDLAAALGLAQTTIANYEQKLRFPDEGILVRIADYFGVSLDHLMGRDDGHREALSARGAEEPANGARPVPDLAREYLAAFRTNGMAAARALVREAVSRGAGMKELYLDIFAPALREVGRLWALGQLSVGEEHAFSDATLRLMSLYSEGASAASSPRTTGLRCVAVSASGEAHLIGVRMVADFLAAAGWEVSFPGGNLSIRHLRELLLSRPPSLLALSVTLHGNLNAAADLIRALRAEAALSGMRIMAGGQACAGGMGKDIGGDGSADDADGAVGVARGLFGL
jgi:MerR family transcriptional regulator, light-induced transcriptional regulator